MTITLKQFINKCQELTDKGFNVWIEGNGNSTWRLCVEVIVPIVRGEYGERGINA